MRKLLYIAALLFFVATNNFAQQLKKTVADTEFYYLYGGTNPDIGRSIKETYDKGYIIAGATSSFGNGDADVYLIKTDSLGKHLWSKTYGGHQNDWGYDMHITADSGYFIAGYSNSFNPPNGFDAYYLKTDKLGNLQWQKTVSGSDWDFIYGSAPMADGGFILCGETYTNSHGGSDAYLIRINKNGDTLWVKNYGGLYDETFNNLAVVNNRIYAVGKNQTHAITPTDSSADGWIVKLDANGNILAQTFIQDTCATCKHFSENVMGITTYTGSIFHFCGRVDQRDSSATVSMFGRVDTSLNVIWVFMDGPASKNYCEAFNNVVNADGGNVFTVGNAIGGLGGQNMFLTGYDPTDGFINGFVRHCGGVADEFGYQGIFTSQGRIVAVGSSNSFCSGLEDVFLVRLDGDTIQNSVLTGKAPVITCFKDTLPLWQVSTKTYSKDLSVKLFPNPANNLTQLEVNSGFQAYLLVKIISVYGTEVQSLKISSNTITNIDLSLIAAGSYFVKITNEQGQNISTLKLVVGK